MAVGLSLVTVTYVSGALVDSVGRRTLMLAGTVIMGLALGSLSAALSLLDSTPQLQGWAVRLDRSNDTRSSRQVSPLTVPDYDAKVFPGVEARRFGWSRLESLAASMMVRAQATPEIAHGDYLSLDVERSTAAVHRLEVTSAWRHDEWRRPSS